ncbi:hypothetical protein ACOME3_008469 [Neoechinorhynchus agilis]
MFSSDRNKMIDFQRTIRENNLYLKEYLGDLDKWTENVKKVPVLSVEVLKERGNLLFKSKQYREALMEYRKAIREIDCKDEPKMTAILHANAAQCLLCLKQFRETIEEASSGLEIEPENLSISGGGGDVLQFKLLLVKGYLGMSYEEGGRIFEKIETDLKNLELLDGSNRAVLELRGEFEKRCTYVDCDVKFSEVEQFQWLKIGKLYDTRLKTKESNGHDPFLKLERCPSLTQMKPLQSSIEFKQRFTQYKRYGKVFLSQFLRLMVPTKSISDLIGSELNCEILEAFMDAWDEEIDPETKVEFMIEIAKCKRFSSALAIFKCNVHNVAKIEKYIQEIGDKAQRSAIQKLWIL